MTAAEGRRRPWIVFQVEGVLLDPRPGVLSVIEALSGATPKDVAKFEATGEYDDPWQLARAACTWVRAGRPYGIPPGGWRVVVNQCGGDPGDLAARADRLWKQKGWRAQGVRVDAERMRRLASFAHLGACTGRDRAWLAQAEELLGMTFEAASTCEDATWPDPQALLRLAPAGHLVGRGDEDRKCAEGARFVFHAAGDDPRAVVDKMLAKLEPKEIPTGAAP